MVNEPEVTDGFQERLSRYIVGIDLGTTNCAVAYVDTESPARIQLFYIDQWTDFGIHEPRDLLPSFHYQPTSDEQQSLTRTSFQRSLGVANGN